MEFQFLARKPSKAQNFVFFFPEQDDIAEIDVTDVDVLPVPKFVGETRRTASQLTFNVVDDIIVFARTPFLSDSSLPFQNNFNGVKLWWLCIFSILVAGHLM